MFRKSGKQLILAGLLGIGALILGTSFTAEENKIDLKQLRKLYETDPSNWPQATVDSPHTFKEIEALPKAPLNRFTSDSLKDLIALGRVLFHDPRLSVSNQISCASCHKPDLNWADGTRFALGHDHQNTTRNTPSVENAWQLEHFFWDGRAASLEAQSIESIRNPKEMNQDPYKLPQKLSKIKGYDSLFIKAYGDKARSVDRITKAIATFEKTIHSRPSDFDKFVSGAYDKMTDQQVYGMHLFRTKARCINCHNGNMFTDHDFHNLGLSYFGREKYEDFGRYNVTQKPEDMGKFKTPSLRNVTRTGPWFHNGLFPTLEGIINMYSAGMPQPKLKPHKEGHPLPVMDPLIKKLDLNNEEKEALVAFLHALSSLPQREEQPVLPK
jgi:cytochrome c peroxidase